MSRPRPAVLVRRRSERRTLAFDNAKKIRALVAEPQNLTLVVIEADSRPEP